MVVLWLGTWNGWKVLYQDGRIWLVNPISGHRRAAHGPETVTLADALAAVREAK